jgi:hypothetical protein
MLLMASVRVRDVAYRETALADLRGMDGSICVWLPRERQDKVQALNDGACA